MNDTNDKKDEGQSQDQDNNLSTEQSQNENLSESPDQSENANQDTDKNPGTTRNTGKAKAPRVEGLLPKVKANAKWNELSPGQQKKLAEWLLEDHLGFRVVWEKAAKEFGFKGSVSSVRRFYERMARERVLRDLVEMAQVAEVLNHAKVDLGELRRASLKVVGQLVLKRVTESPEKPESWLPLLKVLLRNEAEEQRIALRQEEMALKRRQVQEAQARHEFNLVEEMNKRLPELNWAAENRRIWAKNKYELNRIKNDARKVFFGKTDKRLPESAA